MGELAAGAAADLVLVEGDPLEDIGVLADSSNIKLVIKQGLLAKVGVNASTSDARVSWRFFLFVASVCRICSRELAAEKQRTQRPSVGSVPPALEGLGFRPKP